VIAQVLVAAQQMTIVLQPVRSYAACRIGQVKGEKIYVPPFARLSNCVHMDKRAGTVTMPQAVFKKFLAAMAAASGADPHWYGGAYADISKALQEGTITDPLKHFAEAGYFEGRKQRTFDVDEDWYLARYPDVAAGVRSGRIASAHAHYNAAGYYEGRVPNRDMEAEIESWNSLIEQYQAELPVRQTA
jgi:hypothetical protein